MIDDFEANRFKPLVRFHKGGAQRVFYKGGSAKQQPTEQEKALNDVAIEKWKMHQQTDVPAQNYYMDRVKELGSDGAQSFARGVGGSSASAEFGKAPVFKQVTPGGVNVNSGAAKGSLLRLANRAGKSATDSINGAGLSQADRQVGGLQSVMAIGEGQSTTAQAGLSDLAVQANHKAAADAENEFNSRAATRSAAGTLMSVGGMAYMGGGLGGGGKFKLNDVDGSLGKASEFGRFA